jgi:uncharacterized protein (TIGR02246 family)
MKSTITFLFMAFLISSVSFAQDKDPNAEKSKIAGVLDKYADAWATLDIEKFSALFANSEDLVIYDGTSTYLGWGAWKNKLTNSINSAQIVKLSFREHSIQIHPSGDLAWLSAKEDIEYAENGKLFSFKGIRVTWVLANKDDKWVIIHGHWSVPVKE